MSMACGLRLLLVDGCCDSELLVDVLFVEVRCCPLSLGWAKAVP